MFIGCVSLIAIIIRLFHSLQQFYLFIPISLQSFMSFVSVSYLIIHLFNKLDYSHLFNLFQLSYSHSLIVPLRPIYQFIVIIWHVTDSIVYYLILVSPLIGSSDYGHCSMLFGQLRLLFHPLYFSYHHCIIDLSLITIIGWARY